jgi:ureidoglycolate lyase
VTSPLLLRAVPLTAAAFAPYGEVIEAPPDARGGTAINQGSTRRHDAAPALDLTRADGRSVLALYVAAARPFPFTAHEIERHRLSEQVFLPFGAARRCVLLVAPPGPPPAVDALRAFVTDGQQGVRLRAGTWHHGLLALDDGPWAVLERRAASHAADGVIDCDTHALDHALTLTL